MTERYADEIFDALMALDEADRWAEAERRCGGEGSLLQEVRALLRAAEEPLPPFERGQQLGPYRLEACLGSGSSGSVWTAFDEHLMAWTALKLFDRRRTTALEPVLREARAASAIISDHVIRVRGAGRFDEGTTYLEMTLCAEQQPAPDGREHMTIGRSLAHEAPRSAAEAVRLVAEAARGVEAAHRVGVIHRDIKPANLLVTPVSRRALVADFGLSSPVLYPSPAGREGHATVSLAVGDRKIVGTPCFMAPEIADGRGATRASDVYALGATLYAVLAGHPPYQARGEVVDAMVVVDRVRGGPPSPLRAEVEGLSSRLVRIVERAMARQARDRYGSAALFADDLENWLADRPTAVDRGAWWVPPILWARRHRGLVAAASVLVAMMGASGWALAQMDAVRRDLEEAAQAALMRKVDADLAALVSATEARTSAVVADRAAEGARVAAAGAKVAAQSASEAREELAQVTSWAQEQTTAAAADVAEALHARAEAEQRAVEAEIAQGKASEARAKAELAALALTRRLEVATGEIDDLGVSLARERETRQRLEAELAALRDDMARLVDRLATMSEGTTP